MMAKSKATLLRTHDRTFHIHSERLARSNRNVSKGLLILSLMGLAACATDPPLNKAIYDGDVSTVNALFAQGAEVNAQDKKGRTPLMDVKSPVVSTQ